MGTGSYHTVINARKELIDAGLIVCEQGTKGKEYRYALIELVHGIAENAIGIAESAVGTAKSATFIDNIYNSYSNSSVSNQRYTEDIKEIIDYLNQKAGTRYRYAATSTQRHIRARLSEGYSVKDCKAVIDNKCSAWLNDANMRKYLRPETLFGNKFDGYLNEKSAVGAVAHTEEYIPDYIPKVRW